MYKNPCSTLHDRVVLDTKYCTAALFNFKLPFQSLINKYLNFLKLIKKRINLKYPFDHMITSYSIFYEELRIITENKITNIFLDVRTQC